VHADAQEEDVTSTLPGHRVILAASSEYFRALFVRWSQQPQEGGTNQVRICIYDIDMTGAACLMSRRLNASVLRLISRAQEGFYAMSIQQCAPSDPERA